MSRHLDRRTRLELRRRDASAASLSLEALEPRRMLSGGAAEVYTPLLIVDPFVPQAVTVEQMEARAAQRAYRPGEIIVAIEVPPERAEAAAAVAAIDWSQRLGDPAAGMWRLLMVAERGARGVALVHVRLGPTADVLAAMRRLAGQADIWWSSPNFTHRGPDPREYIPNDPYYASQYHHPLMGNPAAWDVTLGAPSIVIAITDDGFEMTHADLQANYYVNPGEIPGDFLDNDGNGYIDDVSGWDFRSGNNNPNPNWVTDDHGTHVAGIAAGRTDNATGIAGTAGHATVLPLQFFDGNWDVAQINETFVYAADMGAHIVSTSYNIDVWVGDPVFTAGMQYMYDHGVLHFTSAGNNNEYNPLRQWFEQTMLIASTTSTDTKSSFSNFGTGVDLSAPGSSILSTLLNSTYGTYSGTSMSTPAAAGVAALIWSVHPGWTRDQVAAQLLATATNIDGLNPAYAGLLGSGRVNAQAALTTTLAPPRVRSLGGLPADGQSTTQLDITSFSLAFDQVMRPESVNVFGGYHLTEAGADEAFGTADDRNIPILQQNNYLIGTNAVTFELVLGALDVGTYRLRIVSGGLENPFGTDLDGDGDGVGGDDFVATFSVVPALAQLDPLGSLVYEVTFPGTIAVSGEIDGVNLPLDAGQQLDLVVRGQAGLTPIVQVRAPGGNLIYDETASGTTLQTGPLALAVSGTYRILVSGAGGSLGGYTVRGLLNAVNEGEGSGGGTNDTRATAEDLDVSRLVLGSGASELLAAVGQLPGSGGAPVLVEDFEAGSLGSDWTTWSSPNGARVQVTGEFGTAGGDFALLMDQTSPMIWGLNEAIWTVDLSGVVQPKLRFAYAEWNDESHPLPSSFIGSSNGDGVAVSEDGNRWYTVYSPPARPEGYWYQVMIDLVEVAAEHNLTLGSSFRIKFQQYDNSPLPADGLGFDEIAILAPALLDDWYSFTLHDGQAAAIAVQQLSAGSLDLTLYDSAGGLLRTSTAGANVTRRIDGLVDVTSDGLPDRYYVRVNGLDARYNLFVTRDAVFDSGANESLSGAQDWGVGAGAVGYVDYEGDVVVEPDAASVGTILDTFFPGVTLSNQITGGSVYASEATFGAPTGTLVFAPGEFAATGWSASHVFRADFAAPTSRVSIDVGSDDEGDVAYFRAYNSQGILLEELISDEVRRGGRQTLTLTRSVPEIAYILAAGVGGDVTPLDRLVYGVVSQGEHYAVDATAGEELSFGVTLPGGGPYLFDNGLTDGGPATLVLELLDPSEAVVATGAMQLTHTALVSGTYRLRVRATAGAGEYVAERLSASAPAPLEVGTLLGVTDQWRAVVFDRPLVDPIVIAGPLTRDDAAPATIRIRNVSGTGFEIRVDEWDYLDGLHAGESASYLVIERGVTTLADGAQIVAGSRAISTNFQSISFPTPWAATPVVLASLVTENDSASATVRLRGVNTGGFSARVQEEEAADGVHAAETIHYIALLPGSGAANGFVYEVGSIAKVTHKTFPATFQQSFADAPQFFAAMQTAWQLDPATVRTRAVRALGADLFLEEEQSADSERRHRAERVGYLAIRAAEPPKRDEGWSLGGPSEQPSSMDGVPRGARSPAPPWPSRGLGPDPMGAWPETAAAPRLAPARSVAEIAVGMRDRPADLTVEAIPPTWADIAAPESEAFALTVGLDVSHATAPRMRVR